jgi:predicted small metal-binding protein
MVIGLVYLLAKQKNSDMKTVTCECGHEETGSSENDVITRMESHIADEHSDADKKKMLKSAERTMREAETAAM